MAIKNKKEITQFLGDGGGGQTTPITKPESTPVGNNVKAIDKTGGKTLQQVSGTGETTYVNPEIAQMLGNISTSTPSSSGNTGNSNPKVKNDKQLIEVKLDGTTQTHNLDATKTPKPGTQTPIVSPENNPSLVDKIQTGLENFGNKVKDFFGKFGDGSKEGTSETTNKYNSSENAYYDVINANAEKPEYKKSDDTSSGAASAEGTQYSWDEKGASKAQNQYQQDLLKAKQDALANRQTIEQNALQYQQQSDMMQYANNQNAEKVGWTGGYVLDQNRQMDYLKASIQAQMYGAMELQKYGYDSALAAARLSYDLNQQEFAHQYYQDAVNVAISEAQITGTYFSAETRDMMSQYNVAEQNLGDLQGKSLDEIDEGVRNGTISLTPEQSQALEVKRNIENWYSANNVSQTGIQTLAAWEAEQSMAMQWADSQWEKYQAAKDAAQAELDSDVNAFLMLDDQGNPIYNGGEVQTGSWQTMSGSEIVDYITNEDGTINSDRQQQLFSYIDNQLGGQVSAGFNQYCTTNEIAPEDYGTAMVEYLNSSDYLSGFLNEKFGSVSGEQATALFNNLNGYTIDVAMPDGTSYTYTLQCSTTNSFGNAGGTKPPQSGGGEPNDGILPERPIIEETYTDGTKLIEELATSEEFDDLVNSLDSINWEEDPMNWYDDVNNTGAQWLKAIGTNIEKWIQDGVKAGDYKAFGESLKETKATIITQIGQENYDLLIKTYNDYVNMSDRDKGLLSDKEKAYYEKISKFAENMMQIDAAIEYCNQNDSNIITNGWDYVGDSWEKTGEQWTNIDNVGDVIVALGETGKSVGDTIVGGVTGFFRWMFGGGTDNS